MVFCSRLTEGRRLASNESSHSDMARDEMKFWQLVSILRGHPDALTSAFKDIKWPEYAEWYSRFDVILENQEREKLDTTLPDDLVYSALKISKLLMYRSENTLLSSKRSPNDRAVPVEVAYAKFGGSVIEDVFERGSANIVDQNTKR